MTRSARHAVAAAAIVTAAFSTVLVARSTAAPARALLCGGDHRWDVKTLSDTPGANLVRYDTPRRHTIEYLTVASTRTSVPTLHATRTGTMSS